MPRKKLKWQVIHLFDRRYGGNLLSQISVKAAVRANVSSMPKNIQSAAVDIIIPSLEMRYDQPRY